MSLQLWVIAWTPVDTLFWKRFLSEFSNKKILSYAISKTPNEQNLLQLNEKEKLYTICLNKCLEFKFKWVTKIIIYCNSLSSSINIKKLRKKSWMTIITTLDVYYEIWKEYKNIFLLTANSIWAIEPEKILRESNFNIKISSFWYLDLVNSIENQKPTSEIIHQLWLKSLLNFSENTNIDLILLGCTHFWYISQELQKCTNVKILDLNQLLKKYI